MHQTQQRRPRTSRLQEITVEQIASMELDDDALILEALLRRGFLALRDSRGVWLAKGSHKSDLKALSDVLDVQESHDELYCAKLNIRASHDVREIAKAIVLIPEHHRGMTNIGPAPFITCSWKYYRKSKYGAKLAVSPSPSGYNALDTGIALLVKTLPLVGVVTSDSCDGHGGSPAYISLWTIWDDVWFSTLMQRAQPNCMPLWHLVPSDHAGVRGGRIIIQPNQTNTGNQCYSQSCLVKTLDDIQCFARRLMDGKLSSHIIELRQDALKRVGECEPDLQTWEAACEESLRLLPNSIL